MDPGLMRRVKYKLHLDPPSMADYVTIFQGVCRQKEIDLPDDVLSWLLEDFYPCHGGSCAAFHPAFIVEHAEATCRYMGREPRLTRDLVADALENLFLVESAPEASAPGASAPEASAPGGSAPEAAPVRAERAS
jgi:chromosomal replication initiation ATPase DnaA